MPKPRLKVSFPTGAFSESGGWSRALDLARLADQAAKVWAALAGEW